MVSLQNPLMVSLSNHVSFDKLRMSGRITRLFSGLFMMNEDRLDGPLAHRRGGVGF
jgi:hypothetical protein